jgi:integral membrane protein (TIGR01906 family)
MKRWATVLRAVIAALLPLVLVLTNVRLLLSPAFVSVEYRTPGFPDDPYGFGRADRIRLANLARVYLLNSAGIEFLGDQQDAGGHPLYNARELRHMVDVKRLVQRALTVWVVSVVVLAPSIYGAWRLGGGRLVRSGLRLGGLATLVLMAALMVFLLASFSSLFTGFHEVFFAGGTWLFYYSDTLIRLFPMRFWRDIFALLLILTLAEAALIVWLARGRPGDAA